MRANSLAFRLTVSAAVTAVVLLLAAVIILGELFEQTVQRNFDARLRAIMDGLQVSIELAEDGSPRVQGNFADTRFQLQDSGWYWQVAPVVAGKKPAASASLLEPPLALPDLEQDSRDGEGYARFSLNDAAGNQLRGIEQRLKIFGSSDDYSFVVTGNFDELRTEMQAFRRALYGSLALLGLGLLGAIFFQVRYGLQPMKLMQRKLNDIRAGKVEMLEGDFPEEMQPIADELNLLVQSNFAIIDRARMQVGNLAHALKTPISVLTNEARDHKGPLADKLVEQIGVMREQVNLYLDRARRAARAQTVGSATDVEPVLQALARTLQRINRDRGLEVLVEPFPPLKFRGERQDLEEMVGNLMDNACKWSKSKVVVRGKLLPQMGEDGRPWMLIEVDDDGPGLPPEQRATAMKRGQRLDESKPGSGLGLNIVSETAAMYGGRADLDQADLGGLRAILRLPALSGMPGVVI
ncbi:MAG: sensor histidine kinase [Phyllobacteriaceae bacterium]|nr:sensor histidine kinase [Phyllobacteriaceae bacterium]